MSAPLPASVAPESRASPGSRYLLRLRLWAEQAPAAVARLREQVAEERAGRFMLPGGGGRAVFVGAPPLWNQNPVPSGDKEALWLLNRHYHWPHFLRLAALDGDEALRLQVMTEWADWIASCPAPALADESEAALRAAFDAPTPWRTLEAGIRMEQTWSESWETLARSNALPAAAREAITAACREHGRVLASIPARLWPRADHNHYLTEMAGLLRLAVLHPELPEAAGWREQAWREIGRCLEAQFVAGGGQIEGCPHYHAVSLRTLAQAILIGREHGLSLPESWRSRLEGALAYVLHSLRPTGVNVPWGDSDATAQGPVLAALLASLAIGRDEELYLLRSLVPEEEWSAAVAEALWHAPDPEGWLARLEAMPAPPAPPRAHVQPELGQAMLRSSWDREAASVFFACRSPVNNGHAHIDPAGFDFTAFGRALAVDPGRYTYREGEERYAFKCAAWHNTVTVDGRDPFAYVDTWGFGSQGEGRVLATGAGPGCLFSVCEHHNFAPVLHRRILILIEGNGALVVVDQLRGLQAAQTVQLWFHLDSAHVELDASAPVATTCDSGRPNLRIEGPSTLTARLAPGRVSDLMDHARDSTRVCFEDDGGDRDRIYTTLLLPRAADARGWPQPALRVLAGDWPRVLLDGRDLGLVPAA